MHCAIVIQKERENGEKRNEIHDKDNGQVLFLALMLAGPVSVAAAQKENGIETDLEDGEYSIQVDLEGGSGKASVSSPTLMLVKNGRMYAELQWSSSNYDYMIVDGEKFQNESEEGRNSVFTIPVTALDDKMEVIADTLAMGGTS